MSELNAGYFRSPSIAGDRIVFLCEDDLWTVAADGGVARRLTSNIGPIGRTIASPDGAFIAYTGTEEGHAEVYVMPADGGPAARRTYLGSASQVRGWTPDGDVLFCSDSGRANPGDTWMHTIGPVDGVPTRLPVGPANEMAFAPQGDASVIGRNTIDPARWKRYRGGTRGDLWADANGTGTFRRLVNLEGNLASPVWLGKRIYFLSDHEGIGNLYSCAPSGRDIRRHTDHGEYYARWAQTDGARIVYQLAAEIWVYDPATDASRRVDVDLRSPRIGRNRRFVESAKYLHSWNVHPDGHALALASRGKLFTMPLWESAVRQYGQRDGVRYRLPAWTKDGASLITVSDEGGEEAIEVYATKDGTKTRRIERDFGRPLELEPSPVGDSVAITNHRNELILVDTKTGRIRTLDRSTHGPLNGVAWSPDGRFIAYSSKQSLHTAAIMLCEVASGTLSQVTRADFVDVAPAFDPEGKFLYFLSYRVLDPVSDAMFFSYSFPRAMRPHLITLQADEPSPFIPKPRGFGEPPGGKKKDEDPKKKPAPDAGPPPTKVDLDGIADRVIAFPVPEGRYSQVHGLRGKVLFASWPITGTLGDDIFEEDEKPKGKVDVYDLDRLKFEPLFGGITSFKVSADNSTLVYRAGPRLRALKAGDKPDPKATEEPGRPNGWIDLKRVRVSVDPASEYRQMYREAWRFQREHFWVADMSGVDWARIHDRYRPLVDKVGSRSEFSDLMWEMLGELGTSHAYEMGGDLKTAPPYRVGHLACDVALEGGRWTITHIVRGDSWEPKANSPLAAPGLNVAEGSTILAINGRPTTPEITPQTLLVHQAGVDAELTIGDRRGRNPRTVVVKTLGTGALARYREWVETNRALVHEATGGRVGYVHIPDMGPDGFSEFHRYYYSEMDYDGLVIDVRYNRGGHVSSILLEKLARERIGYDVTRYSDAEPYWADSPGGPMVCLTNEHAGSDGDIFSHVFKLKNLGPVVGKRTWGGVVGITMRHVLVDNGRTTQPEYSFWFSDVGWGVENYGTDPTHDVDITPQDYVAGRDPQMDTALRLIKQALAKHKPLSPDMQRRPRLTLPKLPPR